MRKGKSNSTSKVNKRNVAPDSFRKYPYCSTFTLPLNSPNHIAVYNRQVNTYCVNRSNQIPCQLLEEQNKVFPSSSVVFNLRVLLFRIPWCTIFNKSIRFSRWVEHYDFIIWVKCIIWHFICVFRFCAPVLADIISITVVFDFIVRIIVSYLAIILG